MAIWGKPLADTPIAVIDFETTGFSPKTGCRVVEVAVVRVEPGREPALVLDTLVDPDGPVHATRIHGIRDEDVLGAPLFSDLVANIGGALEGAVVAAFNAAFDMSFLDHEMRRSQRGQQAWVPPHMCLMYLRPLLNLGPRCSLSAACEAHGLPGSSHRAADDAMAGARLWLLYRDVALSRGICEFEGFERARYKFLDSFEYEPFTPALVAALAPPVPGGQLKPRDLSAPPRPEAPRTMGRRRYWHALVDAVSDGLITQDELYGLKGMQHQLPLAPEDVRAVHAKFAGEIMATQVEDEAVSTEEAMALASVFAVLRELGWAPGDPVLR